MWINEQIKNFFNENLKGVPPSLWIKSTRFIVFGAFAALLPFFLDAVFVHITKGRATTFDLFRRGEMFLVAAGIGFAAVGELIGSKERYRSIKVLFGGLCAFASVLEAGLYGIIHALPEPYNGRDPTMLSIDMFWATLVLGLVCIALSEF